MIKARSLARKVGIPRLYYRFCPRSSDEESFHAAIMTELRPADVVWDIGANVGHFARIFGERTGPTGSVYAFEPTPESYLALCHATEEFPWVQNVRMALSDFNGVSRFVVSESHRRNHLQRNETEGTGDNSVEVPVMRADTYRATCGVTPNVIKIDVEGFEDEVLAGMDELLATPELRAVFVEVHFRLLEERGRPNAPIHIEKLLRSKGLETRWVDESHLAATRSAGKHSAGIPGSGTRISETHS